MTPHQFTSIANVFSEAALLLNRDGVVVAANRVFQRFGLTPQELLGRALTELVADAEDEVRSFLRMCARTREPVLGRLNLKSAEAQPLPCRCDGALVDPSPDGGGPQLLIKFVPQQESTIQFSVLNQKIDQLSEEVRRRQQLQSELFAQQESLRVTLSSIGDAVVVTDAQGRVDFLNPIAEELTGWSQQEAEGQPLTTIFRIVNERTRQPAENPSVRALREGRIVGLANHTILIGKDGTERAIDDSAAPIRERGGRISGSVVVFRDVTGKRAAQLAQARLAAMVNSSDDAILGQTFDGTITAWNAGAEKMFGFTAEETVGKSIFSTIAPADVKDDLLQALQRVRQGEPVDHFETVRRTKDGRTVPVSIRISPIHNEEGETIGASAIDRDISDQRRLQRSLRFMAEASKSLSSLLDHHDMPRRVAQLAIPDFADWCAVRLVAADGTLQHTAVAHADPAKVQLAEQMLQHYPPKPDALRGGVKVLRTGQPELVTEISDEVLREVAHDEQHLELLRQLELRSYLCVPLMAKERILGVVTFVYSQSGRRYQEHDLAMAEDFSRRAAIALENVQLYQKLRAADRHKDEFLAMLAHELRNPLAPIRSGLEILALDADQHRETIELMQEQVSHVTRLVDDLLDVSRIMRGKVELRREPVELSVLVQRSVQAVQSLIDSHDQQLTVSLPDQPVWLQADPVRMVQVLVNLLTNAAKYTDAGGRIELAAERRGERAVIDVRDTGVGIEPELLQHVFDLFTQSARSLDRAQGGLGIGLTLVQRLVEMHGGKVIARSEGAGRGSTFSVRLPLIETPEPSVVRAELGDTAPARRILVVDDNVGAAQLLTALLRRLENHEVDIAHTGPAALEKIRATHPQAVLLDIGLPGMDGHQVAQQIRQDPDFDDVLLVALTGYGQQQDRLKSQQAGFDEHLVKPVAMEQIKTLLAHPKLAP